MSSVWTEIIRRLSTGNKRDEPFQVLGAICWACCLQHHAKPSPEQRARKEEKERLQEETREEIRERLRGLMRGEE
jgi:hypothetical protein